MRRLIKYCKKIPQRHYFPIFVFSSLLFIINELIVISLIILYIFAEKQIRSFVGKLTKNHEEVIWISFITFFLVMIDDYLLMTIIIFLVIWDNRRKTI